MKRRAARDTIITPGTKAISHFAGIPTRLIGPAVSRTLLNITSSQPLVGPVPGFRRPSSGFPNQRSSPLGYEVVGTGNVRRSPGRSPIFLPSHFFSGAIASSLEPIVRIRTAITNLGVNRIVDRARPDVHRENGHHEGGMWVTTMMIRHTLVSCSVRMEKERLDGLDKCRCKSLCEL